MTNDLYSADKVNKLEKVVAQLVARETNKQREFEAYEEFERFRDEASSQIGHDMQHLPLTDEYMARWVKSADLSSHNKLN